MAREEFATTLPGVELVRAHPQRSAGEQIEKAFEDAIKEGKAMNLACIDRDADSSEIGVCFKSEHGYSCKWIHGKNPGWMYESPNAGRVWFDSAINLAGFLDGDIGLLWIGQAPSAGEAEVMTAYGMHVDNGRGKVETGKVEKTAGKWKATLLITNPQRIRFFKAKDSAQSWVDTAIRDFIIGSKMGVANARIRDARRILSASTLHGYSLPMKAKLALAALWGFN